MAAIGSLRKRGGLIVGGIAVALILFLLMTAIESRPDVMRGTKTTVGEVNGEKISIQQFSEKVDENTKNREEQMRGQTMTDADRNYIRQQTWVETVNEIIFNEVYSKLGITVTPEEMSELATGTHPHPYFKQYFTNPQTGVYDAQQVKLILQNLDKDEEGTPKGTRRKQWLNFESEIKKNQYQTKYNNLISKGFFAPAWLAENFYNEQKRMVDFAYVHLPFSDVNDSDIKVSDDDIKKYVAEHAAKYKQEDETRKVDYVTFDIVASASDSAKTIQSLLEKKEEFAKGEKSSDDSLFAKIYSDTPFDEIYYDKDKMVSPVKDSFFSLPVKSIVGPYLDGQFFKLAKISDRKLISDSVRVREIVFSFAGLQQGDPAVEAKYKLMDSIQKAVDSLHGDFAAFAATYSDDPMSKMTRGDIGWVKQGAKDKMYNDILFYRAVKGKSYRALVGQDQVHMFQMIEDKPSKLSVQVTYFSKEIVPSPETERNIYGAASAFAADNQSADKFRKEGAKLNTLKTIAEVKRDDYNLQGLGSARNVVKWIFHARKNEVSQVMEVEKKHVVVLLDDVQPKGVKNIDAIKDLVTAEIKKEKKVEMLSKKVSDAKAASLDELASKLGKTAAAANGVSLGNPSANGMYEPNVVAAAFATAAGKLSSPVKGTSGVFVVQTLVVHDAEKITDYTAYSYSLRQQLQGKSRYATEAQKKLADIEDDRLEFDNY